MSILLYLSGRHEIISANSHFYRTPTEERYIDRVLPCHDLIYLVEGDWSMTEDGTDYQMKKGDVLLLAAGRHHYTRRPCQAGTRTFCVHVSSEPGDGTPGAGVIELPTLMNMSGDPEVMRLFKRIVEIQWSGQEYQKQRLSALFDLLVWELSIAGKRRVTRQEELADQAIALLMDNPHERITAQEAASRLYVSEKTLNNAMNRKTGMPFYTYQRNMKLEMIAAQLENEMDLRIGEIAEAFGFHDEFHLSNAFKKKYGMSPYKYRKMKQGDETAK